MNIHLPNVECSIPLNRGEVEDFINNYKKEEKPEYARAAELPYLKARVQLGKQRKISTGWFVVCLWEQEIEKFKILHITSLS